MWIWIWIFNLVVDSQSVSLIKVGEAEEFVKRLIKAEIEFEFLRQIQIPNIWINIPGSSCRVLACIYFRTTRALKSSFFVAADISHYSSLKIKIKDFSETQARQNTVEFVCWADLTKDADSKLGGCQVDIVNNVKAIKEFLSFPSSGFIFDGHTWHWNIGLLTNDTKGILSRHCLKLAWHMWVWVPHWKSYK